jgi:hypothetical protein
MTVYDQLTGFNPNDAFMKARTYAQQLADLSTNQDAGAMYAMGNRQGAARTLAAGGNIPGAQAIEKGEAEQLQAQHAYLQQAAPALQQIAQQRGPQAAAQAFESLWPDFQRLRMPRAEFDQMNARMRSDPGTTLQMLTAAAKREVVFEKDGAGRIHIRFKDTGQQAGEPFGDPAPQRPIVLPQNADLVMPGAAGAPATEIPVAQVGGTPVTQPPGPAGDASAPVTASPAAPVPIPQPAPRTAAAPVVAPTPPRPAAGAVQPRIPVATDPRGAAPGRGLPPPSAAALGLPNPEDVNMAAPAVPEVAPAAGVPGSGFSVVARGRTSAPKPPQGEITPRNRAQYTIQLRKEFHALPDVKEFNDIAASYETISRLAGGTPTAAADVSLIFAYMKMLDPTSVVREGEQATAANAAGWGDQMMNLYNRARTGVKLTPNQRADFRTTAQRIYEGRFDRYKQLADQYSAEAQELGIDPGRVVQTRIPAGRSSAAQPNQPSPSRRQPTLDELLRKYGQ